MTYTTSPVTNFAEYLTNCDIMAKLDAEYRNETTTDAHRAEVKAEYDARISENQAYLALRSK